jgi:hypothetical protein
MNAKRFVWIIAGVLLFIGLLLYLTIGGKQYRVEVCVTYRRITNCKIASATTSQQAIRTATENACATIASGMTESIECGNTPPDSTKFLN